MTPEFRVGVAYPQSELKGDPTAYRQFGIAAEELNFDHLMMFDHPVNAVHGIDRDLPLPVRAYNERDPFHDPFVAFSHLAALTERIEFVTGILVLPQRQTALVARQAADLALFSGGRLRLGVGIGYNPVEYQALGQDFRRRGRRIDEQIPYLRQLWTGDPTTFQGEFDQIVEAAVFPGPGSKIPIWLGGSSDIAFRRAARLADGFIFGYGFSSPALESWSRVRELLREEGREEDDFRAVFSLLPTDEGSHTIDDIADVLPRLRDAGATDITVATARHGLTTLTRHIDLLAEIRDRADAALA
ncbi:LLM class F420-dependent oxidoreductase [Microbacterium sp. NPDC055357]